MLGLGLALVMNDAEDADGEAMWLGWPDTVNGDDDGGGGDGGEEVVVDGDGRSHVDLGESKGGTSGTAPGKHLFCRNPEIVARGKLETPRFFNGLEPLLEKLEP